MTTEEQLKELLIEREIQIRYLNLEVSQLSRKLEQSYIDLSKLREQLARKPIREIISVPRPYGA